MSGAIVYGKLFALVWTGPWVKGDANLAITLVHLALTEIIQRAGVSMVTQLRATVDGGSENWNFWHMGYFAWMLRAFPDGTRRAMTT